jgi:hypothetical protein
MNKTGKQVQSDIIELLKGSQLAGLVSGGIYRNGYRPRDSKSEDIVVIFTTGLSGQIQTGVVTVNVFVPDIGNPDNGVMIENGRRCEALEVAAAEWVESLTADRSDYRFTLQQTIYTEADAEIHQHFVVIKLKFELLDY